MQSLAKTYMKELYPLGREPKELLKIFSNDTEPGENIPHIRNRHGNLLALSDGSVVRCVNHYYALPDKAEKKQAKSTSPHIECRRVRDKLGLDYIGDMDCQLCHLNCVRRFMAGELVKKR